MVFIANFATFHSSSNAVVFSNCDRVRLVQNVKEVATQSPDSGYHIPRPPFTFKVGAFSAMRTMLFSNGVAPSGTETGELRAKGLIGDKVVTTHVVQSPGVPDRILLRLDVCGRDPITDGVDWVRVHAHICDSRGTTHLYANDLVKFSASGEGSVIADDRIYANPLQTETGITTALIRMTETAGAISVEATAPGLQVGVLRFESRRDQKRSV